MFAKDVTDQELVTLYISGKEKAFEELLLRHKNRVHTYIYMMVKSNALAEDLFQDTFIKVIKTLKSGSYNEEGKFLPWVLRIAHNLTIDYFRKANKYKMISETSSKNEEFNIFSVLKLNEDSIEDSISKSELEGELVGLIKYLPENQKEILTKRIFKGMSFKDIAEEKDISINTALGRMRYALINLRKLVEDHKIEVDL
jgi:RNA polymerase sigma-70 factor (ECF subfamily)